MAKSKAKLFINVYLPRLTYMCLHLASIIVLLYYSSPFLYTARSSSILPALLILALLTAATWSLYWVTAAGVEPGHVNVNFFKVDTTEEKITQ